MNDERTFSIHKRPGHEVHGNKMYEGTNFYKVYSDGDAYLVAFVAHRVRELDNTRYSPHQGIAERARRIARILSWEDYVGFVCNPPVTEVLKQAVAEYTKRHYARYGYDPTQIALMWKHEAPI